MTIRKIIPKSAKSLQPTAQVNDFNHVYVRQVIKDLLDTLKEKQRTLDLEFPNTGGGVGLAANQIEYPYEPVSDKDDSPKTGYYPKDFTPPNIYVVSIRPVRATRENCEVVEPSVYINATFTADTIKDDSQTSYEEGCLSVNGFKGFSIPRYKNIRVNACDETGKKINFVARDFIARVHQHEQDHGLGKEYLNQLNFSVAELNTISAWIENKKINPQFEIHEWIIKDKLKCISTEPDLLALHAWVNHELAETATKIASFNC